MLKKMEFDPGRFFTAPKLTWFHPYLSSRKEKQTLSADFLVESMSLRKLTHQESYTQKLRTSVQMHGNLTSSDLQGTQYSPKALEEGEYSKIPCWGFDSKLQTCKDECLCLRQTHMDPKFY